MSKRFVYNMLSAAVIVISLLIYLFTELDIIKPDVSAKIGILFFSVMTGLGLLNIVYGLINKTRAYIYASGVLFLGSWLYASFEFFEVKLPFR